MTHLAAALLGAALGVFFASPGAWAAAGRAWLRQQTLGRLGL